jgi:hypothetical protein
MQALAATVSWSTDDITGCPGVPVCPGHCVEGMFFRVFSIS